MNDLIVKNVQRDLAVLSTADNYLKFQFEKIKPFFGKRIIEFGAGTGNLSRRIIKEKPEFLGLIEKEKTFCRELNKHFSGNNKVEILNFNLENIAHNYNLLKSKKIDTIIAVNVLEHIKNDLKCLTVSSRLIKERGKIIFIVPAGKLLYSELDKNYGHFRRYSKAMLKNYAQELNLSLIKNEYFNIFGWAGWLIFAKMLKVQKIHHTSLSLFNKLLPLLDKVESIIPKVPFGLSLIGVFKKY